jgi:hypothetical protein
MFRERGYVSSSPENNNLLIPFYLKPLKFIHSYTKPFEEVFSHFRPKRFGIA